MFGNKKFQSVTVGKLWEINIFTPNGSGDFCPAAVKTGPDFSVVLHKIVN